MLGGGYFRGSSILVSGPAERTGQPLGIHNGECTIPHPSTHRNGSCLVTNRLRFRRLLPISVTAIACSVSCGGGDSDRSGGRRDALPDAARMLLDASHDGTPPGAPDSADRGDSGRAPRVDAGRARDAGDEAAGDAAPADAGDASPDAGRFVPWTLEDPGPGGFHFETPLFPVKEGSEVYDCYFTDLKTLSSDAGAELWFSRIKTAINPGSHDVIVFAVRTIVNLYAASGDVVHGAECQKESNFADWPVIANSQGSEASDPYTDWRMPPKVAVRLRREDQLMVRVHYVNTTTQPTPYGGRVGLNFYRSNDAHPAEVGSIARMERRGRVCETDVTSSFSSGCDIAGAPVHVIAANGHFGPRGTTFSMFAWDGATTPQGSAFYTSNSWDHPVTATSLDVTLPAGGGVWSTCGFQWSAPVPPATCADVNARDNMSQNDCCYTYGPSIATSERCDTFVYYYPKSASVVCQ